MPQSPSLAADTADPPETVVHDELVPCPYLPGQTARMPLRLPARPLQEDEFDVRLQRGDRRQGILLYRPTCPDCNACEAIRIDVQTFAPTRSQRRAWRRGRETIAVEIGPPEVDAERVFLFNRHKELRQLGKGEEPADIEGLRSFLVNTCCDTFELRYRVDGRLIGVAVVDPSATALSAVYFYFDPDYEWVSPGVFSILEQIELCRRLDLRYLYLGLYVRGCQAMKYKTNFHPHQRLIDGRWQTIEKQ